MRALDEILSERLRLDEERSTPEWRRWEHRTLNRHRGVLHWRPARDVSSLQEIASAVREQARSWFRVAWWRGFAFGVIVELPRLPGDAASALDSIDTRANAQGTWQWTVLAGSESGAAIGVHTWMEGWLSPPFRGILEYYESLGMSVGRFTKEKDALLRFLTGTASLKGIRFPEFRSK